MCSLADASGKKGEAYVVSCSSDGGPKYTLCILRPGVSESCQIDVLLGVGDERVVFSVSGGSAKVHLTGYEVLEDNGDDDIYGDLEEGDVLEEDEDEDEEDMAMYGGESDSDDDDDDDDDDDEDAGFNPFAAAAANKKRLATHADSDDSDDSDSSSSSEEAPVVAPPPKKKSKKETDGKKKKKKSKN